MNKLNSLHEKSMGSNTLSYGISSLYSHIRFFNACSKFFIEWSSKHGGRQIHEQKKITENRKKELQVKFRNELRLVADVPISGGSGTTNDGNSSRAFLMNIRSVHRFTLRNADLIKTFRAILRAINSGLERNLGQFEQYCTEIAILYKLHYDWYCMPR